jgi:four helix bundle protein
MQDFKTLRVWHLARELSLGVIDALPERVGRRVPTLRSQAIRAAMSVESNLAEGSARSTRPEFLQFVQIALASLNEVEGQLSLARDARVIDRATHGDLYDRINLIRRMLIALIQTLQRRIAEDESKRRRKDDNDS